jgi:hypothetical protein
MKSKKNIMVCASSVLIVILIACLINIIYQNIEKTIIKDSEDNKPEKDTFLYFNITYGIYRPWNMGHDIWTIHDNGSICIEKHFISFNNPNNETLTYEYKQLSNKQINYFKELVNHNDIFSFNDSYVDNNTLTDQPSSSITFIIDEKEKTIFAYPAGYYPDDILRIVNQIENL